MSNQVLHGDALAMLRTLPDECVQCVVTSPPYYGLRAYLPDGHPDKVLEIGLEETPVAYVAKLVEVFREVRRVLRRDGTVWCNLGDSYSSGGRTTQTEATMTHKERRGTTFTRPPVIDGMKSKNLLGIPWRVAFALQEDGWILRADCIWSKTNAMPESVKDRPTKAHEYVFLLSKNERYFYDADAIREPLAPDTFSKNGLDENGKGYPVNNRRVFNYPHTYNQKQPFTGNLAPGAKRSMNPAGRNKRSVWSLPTQSFPGSHFAVMPPKLAETCILAGSSPRACEQCNAPWQRVTTVERILPAAPSGNAEIKRWNTKTRQEHLGDRTITHQKGWQPTCSCTQEGTGRCIVLDPFMGAGTVALVAIQHHRHWMGIELNQAYIDLTMKRIGMVQPLLQEVQG